MRCLDSASTLLCALLLWAQSCLGRGSHTWAGGDIGGQLSAKHGTLPLQHSSFEQTPYKKKLVPRIVHQTYKTGNVTAREEELMRTWRIINPGWETRFYDDGACLTLIEEHFPEYLPAYKSLGKNVERADFFRYLVVLLHGGAYADIDTESAMPLDSLIQDDDAMLVAWEDEHSSVQSTMNAKFSRQRQVLQWMFVAAPGHPALREICERIAKNANSRIDANSHLATLLRTGPGVFTDVVLKYAYLYPKRKGDISKAVRILPTINFGGMSRWQTGLMPKEEPGRAVLHYDLGSWKVKQLAQEKSSREAYVAAGLDTADLLVGAAMLADGTTESNSDLGSSSTVDQGFQALAYVGLPPQPAEQLFPVSMLMDPPFTMMVHLTGRGDDQAGFDVAAYLTGWGDWRLPGILPLRPSVADSLLGAGSTLSGRVFLDIGTGLGFFSLTAASRGQRAHAFELGSKSIASLQASIEYNGFGELITLQQAPLGAVEEEICTDGLASRKPSHLSIDIERGYGQPKLHTVTGSCTRLVRRLPAALALPDSLDVGRVRISASGWEAWILKGLQPMLERSKPDTILVELYSELLEGTGFPGKAMGMIEFLQGLGYTNTSHMGHICVRLRVLESERNGISMSSQDALKPPGWCTFSADVFWPVLEEEAPPLGTPELLLFTKTRPAK